MPKQINLTINGIKRRVYLKPKPVLIDLLREDLNLTGTRQSCDRKRHPSKDSIGCTS